MKARILLVEDEPDIRLIARASLIRSGLEVSIAENGEDALALAAADRPDLILLDWMLPGIDGFETCARLKADPKTATIPVVFLTARTTKENDRARHQALGAIGWIAKPFNPLELGDQVKTLLKTSAASEGDTR
jgi:DNA-binding response OmpR family regulator